MALCSSPSEVSSSVDPGGMPGDPDVELSPILAAFGPGSATDQAQEMTVDDVLTKHVGNFGISQALQFVLLASAWSIEAFQTLVMVFADREPAWRCTSLPPSPPSHLSSSGGNLSYMDCRPGVNRCDLERRKWEWLEGEVSSTVRTFGIECGEEWKVGLAGAAFFLGYFVSASMFGSLSDGSLGRKYTLLTASSIAVFFGFLTSLAPNFWIYVILRACTGFGCAGIGLVSIVLATEPVGPSLRGQVAISSNYLFSLGIVILSILAYFIRGWRPLYVSVTVPTLIFSLLVFIWAKESPRWLLVQGKTEEALEVLRQFAEGNGRSLPRGINLVADLSEAKNDETLIANDFMIVHKYDFEDSNITLPLKAPQDDESDGVSCSLTRNSSRGRNHDDSHVNKKDESRGGNLIDIFSVPETRKRIFIMVYLWFTCAVVYYCLSLSSGSLGTNIYLTTLISGLVELPAYFVSSILIDKVGRRLTFTSMLTTSAISLLSIALTEISINTNKIPCTNLSNNEDMTTRTMTKLIFAIAGKFGASSCYAIAYVYTIELFPTVVRNVALGLTTQAAQCGGILAPIIVAFGRGNPPFPFLVAGMIALVAVFLGLCLPETLNQPLLETMDSFL